MRSNPFRRERPLARYMQPLVTLIADDVVLLDHHGVFAMFELQGVAWETLDPAAIVQQHLALNNCYRNIAHDQITLSFYQCRSAAPPDCYLRGQFRTAFAAQLDGKYREQLLRHSLYANRLFLGIEVRPGRLAGDFSGDRALARIDQLRTIADHLATALASYGPRRLGLRDGVFSEIAETLAYAMTGRWRPVPVTTGRLGASLLSEYIHTGYETIEFQGPGSSWFGAMFGMRHYPAKTWPGMFDGLLSAPYHCTLFQTFRFVATQVARSEMQKKQIAFHKSSDSSREQAAALATAADNLSSGQIVMGDHCLSLLVFGASPDELRETATRAWSDMAGGGAIVTREGLALEAGLFSLCPGNSHLRPRPAYVSSINLGCFAPFHAYPTGEERGYWGGPIALFRTFSGEPYRFHLHVGDVGNTFVCGRSGSGKSTLLAFLIAQAERAGATVIAWDKDRGLKILIHALGGTYLELGNPTGLAPLKRLNPTPHDITFLAALIRGCIMADGGPPPTPEEDRRLHLGLSIVMALPPQDRELMDIRRFLGVSANGAGARLEKWCRGHELGWIIDNEHDCVSFEAPVLGFDQTYILDNATARGPVMATLYHYTESLIDGRRLLFVIDEFWKSLLDEAFRALVNDKLKTLRKRNSPMILATQSPKDALRSPIAHTIIEQCPSAFYFSNLNASWEDYGEHGMRLSRTEFDIVRRLPEGTGEFLLKQGKHSVPAHLPLAGMDNEIAVLSGREGTVRLFDRALAESAQDTGAAMATFQAARRREELSA